MKLQKIVIIAGMIFSSDIVFTSQRSSQEPPLRRMSATSLGINDLNISPIVCDRKFRMTPALQALKAKQEAAIVQEDAHCTEVGTTATLQIQLDNLFGKDASFYQGINLEEFKQVHESYVNRLKEDAEIEFLLEPQDLNDIYGILKFQEEQRQVLSLEQGKLYKIVGELPSAQWVEVDGETVQISDQMYDLRAARNAVRVKVQDYIDENKISVVAACQSLRPVSDSKRVFSTVCCNVPLHEKCLLQAQRCQTNRCPNGACDYSQSGKSCMNGWDSDSYTRILHQQPLTKKMITSTAVCLYCDEKLKEPFRWISPLKLGERLKK